MKLSFDLNIYKKKVIFHPNEIAKIRFVIIQVFRLDLIIVRIEACSLTPELFQCLHSFDSINSLIVHTFDINPVDSEVEKTALH